MQKRWGALAIALAMVSATGCKEQVKQQAAGGEAVAAAAPAGKVTVSAEGTKFDPPVQKSQVPDGSWICDMGMVHYARSQKGDGICPLCSMKLVAHPAQ